MTGSIALDVVIGLIFIYSLYSLLTTTVTEIIATSLNLRASFLAKGIRRMLDDGSGSKVFSDRFFLQPLIKYLATDSWVMRLLTRLFKTQFSRKPSYLSSESFTKNLNETLKHAYSQNVGEQCYRRLYPVIASTKSTDLQSIRSFFPPDRVITTVDINRIKLALTAVTENRAAAKQLIENLQAVKSSDIDEAQTKQFVVNMLAIIEQIGDRKIQQEFWDLLGLGSRADAAYTREVHHGLNKILLAANKQPIPIKSPQAMWQRLLSVNQRNTNIAAWFKRSSGGSDSIGSSNVSVKEVLEKNIVIDPVHADRIVASLQQYDQALEKQAATVTQVVADTELAMKKTTAEKIREVLSHPDQKIGTTETVRHISSLLDDASDDLDKFKALIGQWYNDTMERVTQWYKERIQLITFFVGLTVAVIFNADTISIVRKLSRDPDAREKMVQMASVYVETHKADTARSLDSLLAVKARLENDILQANAIVALGWSFPDSLQLISTAQMKRMLNSKKRPKLKESDFLAVNVRINRDSIISKKDTIKVTKTVQKYILLTPTVPRAVAEALLVYKDDWFSGRLAAIKEAKPYHKAHTLAYTNAEGSFAYTNRLKYVFANFWGLFLTAIALSLGAPFWFDLLNKLVRLRTAIQPTAKNAPLVKGKQTTN